MSRILQPRDIVDVQLPAHDPRGREQEGYRPAILIGRPDILGVPRYPLIFLVPLTAIPNSNGNSKYSLKAFILRYGMIEHIC